MVATSLTTPKACRSLDSYRVVVLLLRGLGGGIGAPLTPVFRPRREVSESGGGPRPSPLASRVLRLSGLFALDSLTVGIRGAAVRRVLFYLRFGVHPATHGARSFLGDVLDGILGTLAAGNDGLPRARPIGRRCSSTSRRRTY